jgi:sec-independent protein translocase protein TatA
MGGFGFNEILIVLVLVFFLFGAKKIPELMRGMGKGMREFNDARNNGDKEPEEEKKGKAATQL